MVKEDGKLASPPYKNPSCFAAYHYKQGNRGSFGQQQLNWPRYIAVLVCSESEAVYWSSAHLIHGTIAGFDCSGLCLGEGSSEECMQTLRRLSVNEVRNVRLRCDWTDAQSFDVR